MISKLAVKRPVTTLMLVCIVIGFGLISLLNLKMDLFPNLNVPMAVVQTSYSSAGPAEIEELITRPLEGVLGTVPRIKNITSNSSAGSSLIILEFEDNTDMDIAALDIREKVDLINGALPEDASSPIVIKIDPNAFNNFLIAMYNENLSLVELKTLVDDKIANRLERLEGVASVSVSGGLSREILIELSESSMRGYNLTEAQIIQSLAIENRNTPIGQVKQGDKNLQLRIFGEFESISDIENLPITTPTGATIFLRSIATVSETLKDASSLSYVNGIPSVTVSIQKQSTANVVNVSDSILREINNIKRDFPEMQIEITSDPAEFIRATISGVTQSAMLGGIIAVIILLLFLRNFKSTIIISTAIPISIIAAFALMYYANITLNIMSLAGLALGVGMLIDNSIIVLESIYRKLEQGLPKVEAAIEGAKEVTASIIAVTLTTIAVFLPVTFTSGMVSMLLTELALTIVFSISASLFVAITLVPMACSVLLDVQDNNKYGILKIPFKIVENSLIFLEKVYKKLLIISLRKRKTVFLVTFCLIILTFFSLKFVPFEFIPSTDEGELSISINLPKGTLLEHTEETTNEILNILYKLPGDYIETISHTIGGGADSSNSASISISLVDKRDRSLGTNDINVIIRDSLRNIPGAEITVSETSSFGNISNSSVVSLELYGQELDELQDISDDISQLLNNLNGIDTVTTSFSESIPQATIILDRNKASAYGITSSTVNSIVTASITGSVATKYKTEGTELDVRLQHNNDNLNYINDITSILIPSPYGVSVPLYEIANIEIREQPTTIYRSNNQRVVNIDATILNSNIGTISTEIRTILDDYYLPEGYTWRFTGDAEDMSEAFGSLLTALIFSIVLVYMVMAAQFESFTFPFIVMFSVPIALTGGLSGLFITGNSLSILSFLGLIMLSGIVLNSAIVLIDYINLLIRERDYTVYDAILTAGTVRLRPILMTAITTILGLVPMLIATSSGAELLSGLASVIIFGLSLSTLVTLILIPVIYLSINKSREKRKNKKILRKQKKQLKQKF